MVSFALGKEIEKHVFVLSWAWGIEKILSAQEDPNLRRADSALWCVTTEPRDYFSFVPRSWKDDKHLSRISIVDDGAFFLWMSLYKNLNMKAIFAVMNTTEAVVKEGLKKIQACTGFEPMTSAIPVQCSTNWANKPTGSFELRIKTWIWKRSSQLWTLLKQ